MKISKKELNKLIESFLLETEDENIIKLVDKDDSPLIDILKAIPDAVKDIKDDDDKTKILIPQSLAKKLNKKPTGDSKEVLLTKSELDKALRNSRAIEVEKNKIITNNKMT